MLASRLRSITGLVNTTLLVLVGAMAATAVVYTLLSATGLVPWFALTAIFGETVFPQAGTFLQVVGTFVIILFATVLPSSNKIVRLENSHRTFHMKMDDVARAYHAAHAADREGMFTLSAEFDAVRERLTFLREHPELGNLETDILEVAAQMSQQSRELARLYSNDNVERARTFLRQRQQEADKQNARIEKALAEVREIEHWAAQVDVEESVIASRLSQLDDRLADLFPFGTTSDPVHTENVYPLQPFVVAE